MIAVFEKFKNNRWKKTRSINRIKLVMMGYAYDLNCLSILLGLNREKTRVRARKIKIKTKDWEILQGAISSVRTLPNAINGDYIWYYGINNSISNLDEKLIP